MTINPGAAEVPHRQIAAQLRERIRRGEWQPGERLPSIPAMAEMFGVAKQTVQRMVDQLRVEGILITKPGSGTYVRGNEQDFPSHANVLQDNRSGRFYQEALKRKWHVTTRHIEMTREHLRLMTSSLLLGLSDDLKDRVRFLWLRALLPVSHGRA